MRSPVLGDVLHHVTALLDNAVPDRRGLKFPTPQDDHPIQYTAISGRLRDTCGLLHSPVDAPECVRVYCMMLLEASSDMWYIKHSLWSSTVSLSTTKPKHS
jgi:hypothetical protein